MGDPTLLAPELDAAIQPLFGYVQDNINRAYPTMHLAYTIGEGESIRGSYSRRSTT